MPLRPSLPISLIALTSVALTLEACGGDATDTDSADHTVGVQVQDNRPYWWAASSYDDFRSATEVFNAAAPLEAALPEGDPLTVRVQTWLDRVDAIVRADTERRLGAPLAAPRPIARILQSRSKFNAWVSGVPACVGGRWVSQAPPEGAPKYFGYLTRNSLLGFESTQCVSPPGWNSRDAAKFWNDDKPACSIAAVGGVFTTGPRCSIDPSLMPGAELTMAATSPFIHFSTDLLATFDEATLAVVAAHELGHYYRGHTTEKGAARYNFWYTRGSDQAKKPVPSSVQAQLVQAYEETRSGPRIPGDLVPSHYSPRIRRFLVSGLGWLLRDRTEPDFVCKEARDLLTSNVALILEPLALNPWVAEDYVKFEGALRSCAGRIRLGDTPSAHEFSLGEVLSYAAASRPGPRVVITTSLDDNLGAFIDRLDAQAKGLDKKAASLLQRARENNIGLYTTEQEADDFALEITTRLGFSADEVFAAWLSFMDAMDSAYLSQATKEQLDAYYASIGELYAGDCRELLAANFTQRNAQGSVVPRPMSLGQLDEPHHTSCYRLYNLWRESKAHRYVPAARVTALAPEWNVLKLRAAQLTREVP